MTLSWPGRRGIAVLLLLVALAIRAWDFGNPVIDADEQYYLLVGDHMLHGAVPYIDLWDRKPIGLFALFAAIRLLPGDGILAYQLLATAAAWATSLVVALAAGTLGANRRGAFAAGVVYLAYLAWQALRPTGRGVFEVRDLPVQSIFLPLVP